jgi:hypothetical protein
MDSQTMLLGARSSRAQMKMTPGLSLKVLVACAFGTASIYYLNTGRKNNDVGRLILAAVFGILTFLVFAL